MTNGGRYMFLAWALIFAAGEAMAAAVVFRVNAQEVVFMI